MLGRRCRHCSENLERSQTSALAVHREVCAVRRDAAGEMPWLDGECCKSKLEDRLAVRLTRYELGIAQKVVVNEEIDHMSKVAHTLRDVSSEQSTE